MAPKQTIPLGISICSNGLRLRASEGTLKTYWDACRKCAWERAETWLASHSLAPDGTALPLPTATASSAAIASAGNAAPVPAPPASACERSTVVAPSVAPAVLAENAEADTESKVEESNAQPQCEVEIEIEKLPEIGTRIEESYAEAAVPLEAEEPRRPLTQ